MEKIFLPSNSAVMFIRCTCNRTVISKLPNVFNGEIDKSINVKIVKTNADDSMDIDNIKSFYIKYSRINIDSFYNSNYKYAIITLDLDMDDLMNLQYVLVLEEFFNENKINYKIIIKNSDSNAFYKLSHYFNMQYPIFKNVYIKQKLGLTYFSNNMVGFVPGEILPFFKIDKSFYEMCLNSFDINYVVIDKIKNNRIDIFNIIKLHYKNCSEITKHFLSCIYAYLDRLLPDEKLVSFLNEQKDTPYLAMMIFLTLYTKNKKFDVQTIYEQSLDYALSIEQIIENSFFYSKNGIFSFRIVKEKSSNIPILKKENDEDNKNNFYLDISLIDYNPKSNIVNGFFSNLSPEDKVKLKKDISKDNALSMLFNPKPGSDLYEYFCKSEIIVHHYGLQTVNLLAKKTNSLLCVKSGRYFYANDNSKFIRQNANDYPYSFGSNYRIIIPIEKNKNNFIYTGLNNNSYDYSYNNDEYTIYTYTNNIDIPVNRNKKNHYVEQVKSELMSHCNYKNKIFVINAKHVSNRLELEFLIKGVLALISNSYNNQQSLSVAIINVKNKSLLKLALRFIALSYNFKGINDCYEKNAVFICNSECDIEILISGNNYNDIINNLSEQRVFGAIDKQIFDELSKTLENINRSEI